MDQSLLLMMLSNLLQLRNQLDPTSSLLSDNSSSTSTSLVPLLSFTSAAPLLFLTIASVLSFLASSHHLKPSSSFSAPNATSSSSAAAKPSEFSVSAFRALSTDHIWAMEAPLRDAQWRSLYGLSYPVFSTVVDKLKPYIAQSQLSLSSDYAVAMVLSRLSHASLLKP